MTDLVKDPQAVRFEAAGVSGTVRPLRTGRDAIYRAIFDRKLRAGLQQRGGDDAALVGLRIASTFAGLCVCAFDVTGFSFPPLAASEAEVAGAFMAWIDRDVSVCDACSDAFDAANAPTNDPDLLPPSMIPDEKKAKPPKSGPPTVGSTTNG